MIVIARPILRYWSDTPSVSKTLPSITAVQWPVRAFWRDHETIPFSFSCPRLGTDTVTFLPVIAYTISGIALRGVPDLAIRSRVTPQLVATSNTFS